MSEEMTRQLGNFIGRFLEYDATIITRGIKKFMRIKVCLDIRSPLKIRRRVIYGRDKSTYATFQYERLSLFCFMCGRIRHGESFCLLRLMTRTHVTKMGWDLSLRAPPLWTVKNECR